MPKQLTTEYFIKKAKEKHGDKYDYSLVNYINNKVNIEIICSIHGSFLQTPLNHLNTIYGCCKCGDINNGIKHKNTNGKNKVNFNKFTYTEWEKQALKSKNFDSFKVYIIECWNEDGRFYKIGKTFTKVKRRYQDKKRMPYKWKIVEVFEGLSRDISILEKELQNDNKINLYLPKIPFSGMYECYHFINKKEIDITNKKSYICN